MDDKEAWTAHRYMSGEPTDGGRVQVPTLRVRKAGECTWMNMWILEGRERTVEEVSSSSVRCRSMQMDPE